MATFIRFLALRRVLTENQKYHWLVPPNNIFPKTPLKPKILVRIVVYVRNDKGDPYICQLFEAFPTSRVAPELIALA